MHSYRAGLSALLGFLYNLSHAVDTKKIMLFIANSCRLCVGQAVFCDKLIIEIPRLSVF